MYLKSRKINFLVNTDLSFNGLFQAERVSMMLDISGNNLSLPKALGIQLHSALLAGVSEFPTRISAFLSGKSSQHRVVNRTYCTGTDSKRSTVHQGDFSDCVSVHFLPSWTVDVLPSTAFWGCPPLATLEAEAGLCTATFTAQMGRLPFHLPVSQRLVSSPKRL